MPQLLFREEALQMTFKKTEVHCFFFVSLMIKAIMLYIYLEKILSVIKCLRHTTDRYWALLNTALSVFGLKYNSGTKAQGPC